VNAGLDENKSEFGILVLSIALKMFTHGNSLRQISL
jgi:hypothetical protein